jgi:hypothetical protein
LDPKSGVRRKKKKIAMSQVELSGRHSSEPTCGSWWCMAAGVPSRQPKLNWGVDLLQRGEQIQKMNN